MNEAIKPSPVIHIACYHGDKGELVYLYLRRKDPSICVWSYDREGHERETDVWGDTIPEALRLAHKRWKSHAYRTVLCGSRFTLPERDEHGTAALFYQMVASYSSMNGVYLDEELGHNCIVQNASREAKDLWKKLKSENRL